MIKITKRAELPKKQEALINAFAIIFSIVCAGLVILILGYNPVKIFHQIIVGALGTEMRIQQTILKAIPLLITSLGIAIAFKMKFWNIGGEGQIIMGAFGASLVALNIPPAVPSAITLLAMSGSAIFFGGLWAFIPAFFKAKMGTNETIFTLMMNYIAIKWVTYLQYGPWKDPASQGFPKIANFEANAILPSLFGVHIGWVIALVLVALIYIFMNHTKKGFEIAVVGESIQTARYAGMNINAVIITAMLISGGLCGMAGMIQASAIERTLTSALSGGYGFTAIITTWLGRLSPPIIMFVCFAFAILLQGGAYLQIAMSVPAAVADMIQGIILFFVLGSEFFLQYKVGFALKSKKKEVA
ncbi:MAG: ABC transporter permease [Eubacteriales bacterium]|nr:ABC transporter permease [Eubacteriales bacterium]MDD3199220.1 ABC transporter permease [Eubacteriales bacterium]MDD4122065.1 ABC transporter permease [Eubacteriales bacterium]MDD4629351.1 ABC transporter permease [Eubacteriales bacterium]